MSHTRKGAVFYHYFEANKQYRENLIFFLSLAYRPSLDFFIVISGTCSVDIPKLGNITCIRVENTNYDFGGYVAAVSSIGDLDRYDYFLFVNSSVRGPFVPASFDGCWTQLFTSLLSDDIHLVGSSINILKPTSTLARKFEKRFEYPKPYSHVQTTAYALSSSALKHLIDTEFYSVATRLEKDEIICQYEIRLSQEIKRNGWNISCILPEYNKLDYRSPHTDINFSSVNGDPLYNGAYFGRTAHPLELIFVKTNRNLISNANLYSHTYCALLGLESADFLKWTESSILKKVALNKIMATHDANKSITRRVRRRIKNILTSH